MGAGIAKQIAKQLPAAYTVDLETKRGENKLGTYTSATSNGYTVINLYTQYHPGADFRLIALIDALNKFKEHLDTVDPEYKLTVAGPRIGCGLGGGNWSHVEGVINAIFSTREIVIYTL